MDGLGGKLWGAWVLAGTTLLAGCAGLDSSEGLLVGLFDREISDTVPGVASPAERIAMFRKLGQEALEGEPGQQQAVCRQLAAALQEEADPLIRMEIVRALGQYRTSVAASALAKALEDPDPDVHMVACEAWGNWGGPEATAKLAQVLSADLSMDVRLAAAKALGQTGNPGAVVVLGEALEDRDPAMQYRAVQALRKLTGQQFGNDVNRWRQYVQYLKGQAPAPPKPLSLAERVRQMF